MTMFPKPKDAPKPPPEAYRVMPDRREICFTVGSVLQSRIGRAEYRRRTVLMWKRQKGICCLFGHIKECPGPLAIDEATFEHENGRSGGKRDDRIEIDGRWINGAAHWFCNNIKGSRRIRYNSPATL